MAAISLLLRVIRSPFVLIYGIDHQGHLLSTSTEIFTRPCPIKSHFAQGMNPLLRNPWMVIHPPIVFFGYAAPALLMLSSILVIFATFVTRSGSWASQHGFATSVEAQIIGVFLAGLVLVCLYILQRRFRMEPH